MSSPPGWKAKAKNAGRSSALHGLRSESTPPRKEARNEASTTPGLPPGILYGILEDPDGLQPYQHLAVYKEGRGPVDAGLQAFPEVSTHQSFVAAAPVITLEPLCIEAGLS